jgi:large subunit ribosomal protein L24
MKIIKGDTVQIMMGKDKGKTGAVLRAIPSTEKVLVEGINQFKRHVKGRYQGQKSEIVTISKPLPTSAVALVCKKCKKVSRVGFEMRSGKKVRICKRCKSEV